MRQKNQFDIDSFFRAIILFGFMFLLMWLIDTQQLTLYINPRFAGFVEITSYVLLLLAVTQALTIIRPVYHLGGHHGHAHANRLTYIPFIAVLILAFALPGNTLNANLVNNKGLNSQLSAPAPTQEISRPLASKLRQLQLIEVTDRDYTEIMSEIELFPQDYLGKEVTMTGFVFRALGADKNQFSLVRYVIVCCAADALPYGVLCEIKDSNKYEDGTWLAIRGVIQNTNYENKIVPAVKITSLKQVKEPKAPYVFPLEQ